ncbi:14768_t:CDS:2 [Funneliformis geosporum]|uniref:9683_t:CDS:1 n=1 Tax=Funneliformis geosporum TaxID=1117311 RepID=A0A9W4WSE9_9GLOM|nr:14768_t:CDS:2 [Funneliformis geosporum]CAI2183368.1 9683_t:CDS:2 [Funneliformis geosporum]
MDLSRYYIGKGREEQVELLSDDELSDFYSQGDYEELEKIEKRIKNIFLVYEKVSFINVDQILDLYHKIYCSEFNWDNFARSSDTTLSEFIREIWPKSFMITTCPHNKHKHNKPEWISLLSPDSLQDEPFDMTLVTKEMKSICYDKGFYDIRFGHDTRKIEENKLLKKQEQRAEQVLWKTRHLFPNKTILNSCCLELLYKDFHKENVDITSTGYQSFSELLRNSIIWKSIGNDRFIVRREEDQKRDSLLYKKEIVRLSDMQLLAISIISSNFYGDD